MQFDERVAVVTGGGHGIGYAACRGFADRGAAVVVVDIDGSSAEATADDIRSAGGDALAVGADVTSAEQAQGYVHAALDRYGRIDCFFNNAGIGGAIAQTAEYDVAEFDAVINVNVRGVFLGLRYMLPQMIKQRSGAIVNTGSTSGLIGSSGLPAYVASKHAVHGLTKTAAIEVARRGVRVNAVCPGPVDTRAMRWIEESTSYDDADEIGVRYRAAQPTGRYSTPEEIANTVLFLCSDLASHTNGACYLVDGGRTAGPTSINAMED